MEEVLLKDVGTRLFRPKRGYTTEWSRNFGARLGIMTVNSHQIFRWNGVFLGYTTTALMETPVELVDPAEISLDELLSTIGPRLSGHTGADPEFLVVDEKEKILPAFRFLPKQSGVNHHPYADGFAAEFKTKPETCHGYFIDNLRSGLINLHRAATTYNAKARLTLKNTVTIAPATMRAATEEEAALGCTPSMSAYDEPPMVPIDGKQHRLRSAGGHIHFGINAVSTDRAKAYVKALDLIVGIPTVALFANYDNFARRRYYGRAGEYRLPKHGLEYRTLSNAWLGAPEIAHLVLNLGRAGLKFGHVGIEASHVETSDDEVRAIINTCDVAGARKYVLGHLSMYKKALASEGHGYENRDKCFKIAVEKGIDEIYPDYSKLEVNWHFNTSWQIHSNSLHSSWGSFCARSSR